MKKLEINQWDKYNRLTIIEDLGSKRIWKIQRRIIKCKCDCWNITELTLTAIRIWWTQSCWCLKTEINTTHWMNWTDIYSVFNNIKDRCYNKTNKNYKNYWWRWIECEWGKFEDFYKDMWDTYKKWLTIDRENNDWDYKKSNCKWITNKKQQRNKRTNIVYKWKCIWEWTEIQWFNKHIIYSRIKLWWSIEKAIFTKVKKYTLLKT